MLSSWHVSLKNRAEPIKWTAADVYILCNWTPHLCACKLAHLHQTNASIWDFKQGNNRRTAFPHNRMDTVSPQCLFFWARNYSRNLHIMSTERNIWALIFRMWNLGLEKGDFCSTSYQCLASPAEVALGLSLYVSFRVCNFIFQSCSLELNLLSSISS